MEIEAKFILPDAKTFRRLRKIKVLAGYTLAASRVEKIQDTYLDTADRLILAAGYTCRRRERSGEITITLKRLERATKAVRRCEEFEVKLPTDQPLAQWPESPARDLALHLVGENPLAPLVHLEQKRTIRALSRGSELIAELSLDDVSISDANKTLALLELEVELMPQGAETDLAVIAAYLQDVWKLDPDPRSKFEHAFEFANANQSRPPARKQTKPKPKPRTKKLKKPGIKIDDSMSEAARKTLLFEFQRMVEHEGGTRAGLDIEELHDMRVATRRMRAALAVFEDYLDEDAYKPFSKSLRRTGRALGAVRDLDVFRVKTQYYLDQLPSERQNDLAPLLVVWQIEHVAARDELLAYLDSEPYQRFKKEFPKFLQMPSAGTVPILHDDTLVPYRVRHVLPPIALQCLAPVRSFEELVARGDVPLTRYHQLRIVSKRLRYTLEYFREVLGTDVEPLIDKLKRLQDHLGDLQDAVMACDLLRDFLSCGTWANKKKKRALGPTPVVAPGVVAYLAARQEEIQAQVRAFPLVWSEISSQDFNRQLTTLVGVL